jgi:hypothetical protein
MGGVTGAPGLESGSATSRGDWGACCAATERGAVMGGDEAAVVVVMKGLMISMVGRARTVVCAAGVVGGNDEEA